MADLMPRSPRLPSPMFRQFDVDCGDDVLPGHTVIARGLIDGGRSVDDLTSGEHAGNAECQMLSLSYELVPGVTPEEAVHVEVWTPDISYGPDAPLTWSTGGSGPGGLGGPGGYEDPVGGASTIGESGPWPAPDGTKQVTFWLHRAAGGGVSGALRVALTTGAATWEPAEPQAQR